MSSNINDNKNESLNNEGITVKTEKDHYMLIMLLVILILTLSLLAIISTHSTYLIRIPINYIVYITLSLFICVFVLLVYKEIRKRKKGKIKKHKIKNALLTIVTILYAIGCASFTYLLYGPYENFRTWFISTAMSTMNHSYLCKWFYNDDEIAKVTKNNYLVEVDEETDTELIELNTEVSYANEYEEQILKRDSDDKYKIIDLKVNDQKAYLAVIYDPSKVKVAVSSRVGTYGQYATAIAEKNGAILAVNGGGFSNAPGNQTGGRPTGVTISNGKVITDNTYSSNTQSGGLIGMTYDDKLVLIKDATANKAINMKVRDGVSWGPFLIVNGKKAFIKGNGGWGYAARTAIGQRSDGIILLLVVDSNSTRSKGADMVDLTKIMSDYGAINAANLDGGTSSVMVLPKSEAQKYKECNENYCYINDPIDSTLAHKTRGIATTVIVTE